MVKKTTDAKKEKPSKEVSKKEIYNQYKFSLCFENSISRSYITEKIFDCFFEKIIPILSPTSIQIFHR